MAGEKTAGSEKALVLVCGAARSGTTMLDLMLGNSSDVFSTGEIYALFRPFRTHHFDPVCSCGEPDCAVWSHLRHVPASEFHIRAINQPGIRFVIDSSKDLRWVLDSNRWASNNGLKVYNVLIWKDAIDLAYSHWKRGLPANYFCNKFITYYQRFLDLDLPFVSVSYSRLINNSTEMLPQLCEYLGMEFYAGREEFWNKQHHHFFGSAGIVDQLKKGSSEIGLQRDFPDEFLEAFQRDFIAKGADRELNELVARVESFDLGKAGRPCEGRHGPGFIRPGWYYRHVLKGLFRRYFPDRKPVVD